MKKRLIQGIIVVAGWVGLVAVQSATGSPAAGRLTPFPDRPGAVVTPAEESNDLGAFPLAVTLRDGRTEQALQPVGVLTSTLFDYGKGLSVRQELTPTGRHTRWRLILTNSGEEQRWLHLRLVAQPGGTAETSLFDGRYYRAPCKGTASIKDLEIAVPLVAMHRSTGGLAWGIHPDQIVSYFEGGSDFSAPNAPAFFFGVKIVVDPGAAETLEFISFGFEPRFGYLDAFQVYHREFPKNFSVRRPNVDPRVRYGGCDYKAWKGGDPETVRRFGGRWEWCLRSFVHRGDWKVTPEFFEIGRASGDKRNRFNKRSFEQATTWRDKTYERYPNGARCDVAMLFYYTSGLSDDDGPRKPLVDALWPDAYAGTLGTYKYCYSWGDNAYAKQSLQALTELAEELPISGFAMDTAGSPLKHYGAGIEATPCRAYTAEASGKPGKRTAYLEDGTKVRLKDEQTGVYSRVTNSVAQFMDYVHTLDKGGYKLALVPNKPDWIEGPRCDAALIEHVPGMLDERLWIQRLYCGQKLFSWWDEFRLYQKIDWQNMAPEQIRNSIWAFSRFVRLKSYMLAGIPMWRIAVGNEVLQSAIDELNLLTQAGWQVVPACRTDSALWLVRYGEGLGTYLVACNPKAQDITADLSVDTSYMGGGGVVFADQRGGELQGLASERRTHVTVDVASAHETIIQPVFQFTSSKQDIALRATTTAQDTLDHRTLTVALTPDAPLTIAAQAGAPAHYYLDTVEWNGTPLPLTEKGEFILSLTEPGTLTVRCKSLFFASPGQAFTDFPFVRDLQPQATIVIPDNPSAEDEYVASRVQKYFLHYYAKTTQPPVEVVLPIVRATDAPADGPRVLIGKAAAAYSNFWPWESPSRVRIGVDPEKQILYITARELCTGDQREGLYRLFAHLDRTHPSIGVLGDARFEHEYEKALFEKSGLLGKVLALGVSK